MRIYLIILFFLGSISLKAQVEKKMELQSPTSNTSDTVVVDAGKKDSLKIFKPTIKDYLFYTQFSEKKVFDTVLSHDKTYIFSQFNNRDNFGRLQMANIGSGFNPLSYEYNDEQNLALLPTHKSYSILEVNDVKYYDVKTPTAVFTYHNAMRNGATLNSTYTQNIGKTFNFAVEYMGLRSQGMYRNSLASNNNTIFSAHFKSKSGKYEAFAHYLHQNVDNQENGGLLNIDLFLDGDEQSNNRNNMQVNLTESQSKFSYRRYYLSHQFTPFKSEKFPFRIRHTIFHQGNKYYYQQTTPESYWYLGSDALVDNFPSSTKKYSNNLSNTVSLVLDNETLKLDAGVRYQNLQFGLANGFNPDDDFAADVMKESRFGAVGNLQVKLWNKLGLKSFLEYSNGSVFGNYLKTTNLLKIEPFKDYFVNAKVNFQSVYPSFNYLKNSSVYDKYNFQADGLKNQSITEFGGSINLKWFQSQIFVNYFRIDNYTYFDQDALPKQTGSSVNITQIGGEATFNYGKFFLNTRLQFQNVLTNKEVLPLPDVIARANLYFQTKAFKKAAEIQTGVKAYYFNKFTSRAYLPIYNEYILQGSDARQIGGQPLVDVYFNLKIKKIMFFVEGQHLADAIGHNTTEAFPNYPTYDFRLNLGFVWYMFN